MKRGSQICVLLLTILLFSSVGSSLWTDDYREVLLDYKEFFTGRAIAPHESEIPSPAPAPLPTPAPPPPKSPHENTFIIRTPSPLPIPSPVPPNEKCVLQSAKWSKDKATIGDSVSLLVEGDGCAGQKVTFHLWDKDIFVDDDIVSIDSSFVDRQATVTWKITQDVQNLIDEPLELGELEVYFTASIIASPTEDSATATPIPLRITSDFLFIAPEQQLSKTERTFRSLRKIIGDDNGGPTHPPGPNAADIYLGEGCTTIYWIDYDCDGFVIGGKDGIGWSTLRIQAPLPPNNGDADANDNDPNLNTPASVTARYGDFSNINNFKAYLYDLGYIHQINNVYFVSLNGDDRTAQINNINLPYRFRPQPALQNQPFIIQPGDVVVYRGGVYPEQFDTTGRSRWCGCNSQGVCNTDPQEPCGTYQDGLQGTAQQPILLISHPGERVIFKPNRFGVMTVTRKTSYTILDGLEFEADPGQGGGMVASISGPSDHVTFKNVEMRNADKWGTFLPIGTNRDFITFFKTVIHHIGLEHCLYKNDQISYTTSAADLKTDTGWIISNSLFYFCGGKAGGGDRGHNIHWRGGKDFLIENNIFHSAAQMGIEIKNGAENGIIRNNLIFNEGKGALTFFEDTDPQRWQASGNNNMLIANNIFATKAGLNGVGGDPNAFPAVMITHQRDIAGTCTPCYDPPYTYPGCEQNVCFDPPPNPSCRPRCNPPRTNLNMRFYNNIFYMTGAPAILFSYTSDIVNPDITETTMENNIFYVPGATQPGDGAGMATCRWTDNTHTAAGFGCTGAPMPIYYWDFGAMQHPNRPKIRNNIFANPGFTDVQNSYTTSFTPEKFNFLPLSNSPGIDFALAQFAPLLDIRNLPRNGLPDAGTFEFSSTTNFNYRITVTPTTHTVLPGQQTPPYTVTTTYISGTSEEVTLSTPNLPPDVTAQLTQPTCTPTPTTPCVSTLLLFTSLSTPLQTYNLQVLGRSLLLQRQAPYSLTVQKLPKPTAILLADTHFGINEAASFCVRTQNNVCQHTHVMYSNTKNILDNIITTYTLDPDHPVIHGGDIVYDSLSVPALDNFNMWRTARKLFVGDATTPGYEYNRLLKFYFTFGNHDDPTLGYWCGASVGPNVCRGGGTQSCGYNFGYLSTNVCNSYTYEYTQRTTINGIDYLFFNTVNGAGGQAGGISPFTLTWLTGQLAAIPDGRVVVLVTHFKLCGGRGEPPADNECMTVGDIAGLRTLLGNHVWDGQTGLKMIWYTGHGHGPIFYATRDYGTLVDGPPLYNIGVPAAGYYVIPGYPSPGWGEEVGAGLLYIQDPLNAQVKIVKLDEQTLALSTFATYIMQWAGGGQQYTLDASPNPCIVTTGTTCTSTITWLASVSGSVQLRVSMDNGPELLVACGASGSLPINWIQLGHTYTFSIYQDPQPQCATTGSLGTPLKSIGVSAINGQKPRLDRLNPSTIYNALQRDVLLEGANFNLGAVVLVNDAPYDPTYYTYLSSTSMRMTVLANTPQGDYNIKVRNPDQQNSDPLILTVSQGSGQQKPRIDLIDPSTVRNNVQSLVTITGINFDFPNAKLYLDGSEISQSFYTVQSTTTINLIIPLGYPAGTYQITVRNPDNQESDPRTLTVTQGSIIPVITPSRVSGVAPLAVFFDATGTTASVTTRPFHELDYTWNFGDPVAGTAGRWAVSSKSKNSDKGGVAAHIFETSGQYTVTLTVKDSQGGLATKQVTIDVQNPDTVFSGTNTICFTKTTDFTGCPAGAQQVTSSNIADLNTHKGSQKRILLRRGDSWVASGNILDLWNINLFHLGAYGTGINPDARGIYQNAPFIDQSSPASAATVAVEKSTDARITDLRIYGAACATCGGAVGSGTTSQQVLQLRLVTDGFSTPIGNYWNFGLAPQESWTLVDSDISNAYIDGVFVGSNRLMILGTRVRDVYDSHAVRIWNADRAVIAHNDISGASSSRPGGDRHALKLHSEPSNYPSSPYQHTQYVIIANNLFGTSGPWPAIIAPQDLWKPEVLTNIIFESNRNYANYGTPSSKKVDEALRIAAQEVTVRNNFFDATGGERDYYTVVVEQGAAPIPKGISVYNNLIYRGDASQSITLAYPRDNIDPLKVYNNIIYAPLTPNIYLKQNSGPIVESNNFIGNPLMVNPLARDFHLQANSPAIDAGLTVPVFDDFEGNARPQGSAYDIGAYEYKSTGGQNPPTAPSNLQAQAKSSTQIDLTWTDNANNEDRFIVERRLLPSGTFAVIPAASNLPPNTQSYLDTGLTPTTSYEYRVFAENSVGKSTTSNIAQATTFLCDNNQQRFCPEQRGVCYGAQETCTNGQWPGCTTTTYQQHSSDYRTTEVNLVNECFDLLDNDCDGEQDYDSQFSVHGDNDCPVAVTQAAVQPTSICPSGAVEVGCLSSVPLVNSIKATLAESTGACQFDKWINNAAIFKCTAGSSLGSKLVTCSVDTTKSYRTGQDQTTQLSVGGANCCSQYTGSTACEGNAQCDWCLGCETTNRPTRSSSIDGRDHCVATGTCSSLYLCRAGPPPVCGASCDSTVGGCSQTQTCNLNVCGCVEQTPNILQLQPGTTNVAATTPFIITGQYFASNAEVLVDNILMPANRITSRTPIEIRFTYQPRDYGVGSHSVIVRNPTSTRVSNAASFSVTAAPQIIRLNPDTIINNVINTVDIIGQEFDPLNILVGGQPLSLALWTSPNHQLVRITPIVPNILPGDYSIVVINRDNRPSNAAILRVNQPFTFTLTPNPSTAIVIPNSQLPVTVTFTSASFTTPETITLTATPPLGITTSFPSGNSCTPTITPPYQCQLSMNIQIGAVTVPQQYTIDLRAQSATAQQTGQVILNAVQGQVSDCTNNRKDLHETDVDCGGPICAPAGYLCDYTKACALHRDCKLNPTCTRLGQPTGLCWNRDNTCQPDADCDDVPDQIDRCPKTPVTVPVIPVSPRNGCPYPKYAKFTPSLTTDFAQLDDFEKIRDLSLGIIGIGRIQFTAQDVSILRVVAQAHQALDLDTVITMQANRIGFNSQSNPELNKPATLTFSGLTSPTIPTPLKDGQVCPASLCKSVSYTSGNYIMTAPGFSEYGTQPGQCGDAYCNLDEACDNCAADCGACSGKGGGGGGGGGGGSGGNDQRIVVDLDANIQQTVAILKATRFTIRYQGQDYNVRMPKATNDDVVLLFPDDSYSIPLNQKLGIDLDGNGKSDATVFYADLQTNRAILTFSRLIRNTIPTLTEPKEEPQGPLTLHPEAGYKEQAPLIPTTRSILMTAWLRIPLVLFVLVLAFYFRYVRLPRIE